MNEWITLTDEERAEFVAMANDAELKNSVPTVFNLESDKHDCGGKFAELSNEQILQAADESAKWLIQNYVR